MFPNKDQLTAEQNQPGGPAGSATANNSNLGQELAAPQSQPQQPQVVYVARPLIPPKPQISAEVLKRHNQSKALYPELNLSDGEFVINTIRRHPIGLIEIWAVVVLLSLLTFAFLPFYAANQALFSSLIAISTAQVSLPLLALSGLYIIGGVIATIVYRGNKFYLTNESVIQIIRISLFSNKEQTISLANIEDASFRRQGILQTLLNYGTLRLSTEGDETTYRFNFVSNPRQQVSILNDAVESFKNGRPVDADENS